MKRVHSAGTSYFDGFIHLSNPAICIAGVRDGTVAGVTMRVLGMRYCVYVVPNKVNLHINLNA